MTSASVPSLRELWPYAETPLRRTRQIVGDGRGADLVCVVVANRERVRDRVLGLQGAGQRAESAGTGISERLRSAGNAVNGVPLLGSKLAAPLRSAGASGNDLADVGARWTTAAWAARRLRCTREGLQVLGVRAAATAPLGAVGGALHPHAGGGGMDQHTLEILGSLELDRLGLRRPPRS